MRDYKGDSALDQDVAWAKISADHPNLDTKEQAWPKLYTAELSWRLVYQQPGALGCFEEGDDCGSWFSILNELYIIS